jgi:hypothetical protein
MKKFKVEKSRSTLWRESKLTVFDSGRSGSDVESDVDGLVNHDFVFASYDAEVDAETCYDKDLNSSHGSMPDNETLSCEESVGWRWLDYSDSDSEPEDIHDSHTTISDELAHWAVLHHIPLSATASLLAVLKPHFPSLPVDPRTLLKTPIGQTCIRHISGGDYCHLGLTNGLSHLLKKTHTAADCIELQINVDGIPLFKSSSVSLWPILCSVSNINYKEPFVVGIYCGKEKPGSAAEFMADFVKEASELLKDGITVDNVTTVVKIHCFVCDAPARAYVKGIKSHSGYSACEKCTVSGDYDGKVIFLPGTYPLRTDDSFNAMIDDEHHIGPCPLNPLPMGFVSQFGLDYMHLVCLGVMRRFLLYWKGPKGPLEVRLGWKLMCSLSDRLMQLAAYAPLEFARKPRSIVEVLRWKATEFREILLYSGIVVLKNILNDNLYDHFLLLFVSIRILTSRKLIPQYCDYAHQLLVKFVHDTCVLYGQHSCVYNIHCLVHLANDVKNLGCLDDFSAFVFENKLDHLKKLVRKPQQPIQQILRRLHERSFFNDCLPAVIEPKTRSEHNDGPILPGYLGARQYRQITTEKWSLSVSPGNNCVLLDKGVPVLIKNIVIHKKDIILICARFETVSDAFLYPLPSSKLDIWHVAGESADLCSQALSTVLCKCVCWPLFHCDGFMILPLLH